MDSLSLFKILSVLLFTTSGSCKLMEGRVVHAYVTDHPYKRSSDNFIKYPVGENKNLRHILAKENDYIKNIFSADRLNGVSIISPNGDLFGNADNINPLSPELINQVASEGYPINGKPENMQILQKMLTPQTKSYHPINVKKNYHPINIKKIYHPINIEKIYHPINIEKKKTIKRTLNKLLSIGFEEEKKSEDLFSNTSAPLNLKKLVPRKSFQKVTDYFQDENNQSNGHQINERNLELQEPHESSNDEGYIKVRKRNFKWVQIFVFFYSNLVHLCNKVKVIHYRDSQK